MLILDWPLCFVLRTLKETPTKSRGGHWRGYSKECSFSPPHLSNWDMGNCVRCSIASMASRGVGFLRRSVGVRILPNNGRTFGKLLILRRKRQSPWIMPGDASGRKTLPSETIGSSALTNGGLKPEKL